MSSLRLHLWLVLLLINVSLYVVQPEDISVGAKCIDEVTKRIDDKLPGKCCKEYLQCHCVKALCRTRHFSRTEPCVGDHLYKQLCADHYRNRCPDLSDSNFAKKCPSVSQNVDQWGKTSKHRSGTEKKQNKNAIITYAIAGVVVLLIVVSIVWGIVWWFFFSKRRKSKEVKSTASKRSSGGLRDRSRSKSKSKTKKSRGSKGTKGTRGTRGKSLGNRGKSNTRRREERAFSGSFNSRAMQTRKISKVIRKARSKSKGKIKEKMQYTKLKMALR